VNSHLPSFSFVLPALISGIVSIGLIFPFAYMYTEYFHHIHLSTPFPYILSTPIGPLVSIPPDRICFAFLCFFKKKKKKGRGAFLFKIAMQGISL
jgi:hypothetical protein